MNGHHAGASATEPRLVEAWAPWCSECRAMDPDLDEVASRFEGSVEFRRVNAATDQEVVEKLRVMATPTLIGYVGDAEVYRATGRHSRSTLEEVFESLASRREPEVPPNRADIVLRVGAGGAMIIGGLIMGPVWPLVAIGGAALASGVHSRLAGRSRADRP